MAMARNYLMRASLILRSKPSFLLNSSLNHFSVKTPTSPTSSSSSSNSPSSEWLLQSKQLSQSQLFFSYPSRCFSSISSSPPSNIVIIKSEEEFNSSLHKAKDESLPAVFYFTATWCGPCKLISPVIEDLSRKYPQVTTYKIDVDQEGLADVLSDLKIYSVPTLHFFNNGTKVSEVVGADVMRLKQTMENLYK